MRSDAQLCDLLCERIAHAYLLHLMATWRRPIYRYESGDIEVNQPFLSGLLDGYPRDRMTDDYRARFYLKMLRGVNDIPMSGVVIFGGRIPELTARGFKYMNALLHEYGDMLEDIGVRDEKGMLTMPKDNCYDQI